MERIKEILKNKFDLEIEEPNENIYASNDIINCLIVKPHSGTKNRWMVRFSTKSAFDRWANSCPIEEFFDTVHDVNEYLIKNQINIYKQLLEYLSDEYDELDELFDNKIINRKGEKQ